MKGGYALVFGLLIEKSLSIGKRYFVLKPGTYVYSGSALNGVEQRVKRHVRIYNTSHEVLMKRNKVNSFHWHIDHLLPYAVNLSVILAESDTRTECALVQNLKKEGMVIVNGFGSTDCAMCCGGHLLVTSINDMDSTLRNVWKIFKDLGIKNVKIQRSDDFELVASNPLKKSAMPI